MPTVLLRQSAQTPEQCERGKAEASEQALAPLEGRTAWDIWRALRAGLGLTLIPRLPLARAFACRQEVGEEEAGIGVTQR